MMRLSIGVSPLHRDSIVMHDATIAATDEASQVTSARCTTDRLKLVSRDAPRSPYRDDPQPSYRARGARCWNRGDRAGRIAGARHRGCPFGYRSRALL